MHPSKLIPAHKQRAADAAADAAPKPKRKRAPRPGRPASAKNNPTSDVAALASDLAGKAKARKLRK